MFVSVSICQVLFTSHTGVVVRIVSGEGWRIILRLGRCNVPERSPLSLAEQSGDGVSVKYVAPFHLGKNGEKEQT